MTKTVLLFSGQGSQYAEMGKELVENFSSVKEIFDKGSEILNFNLREKINNNELDSTLTAQPAIFAVSAAALQAANEAGIGYSAAAGHSLGEYAALYACGVITLEDGFKLLKIRSKLMSEVKGGGMAAVLGLNAEVIEEICAGIENISPVNYNSPRQTVIAGTDTALAKAGEALLAKGAKRIMRLNVSAAFHSPLMKDVAEEFKAQIKDFTFKMPGIPFYSNLTGGELCNKVFDMPNYLARHIYSPVLFTAQLSAMEQDGFTAFLELGPGKVLSGLVKKTLPDVKICNIEDLKSLEAAKAVLL